MKDRSFRKDVLRLISWPVTWPFIYPHKAPVAVGGILAVLIIVSVNFLVPHVVRPVPAWWEKFLSIQLYLGFAFLYAGNILLSTRRNLPIDTGKPEPVWFIIGIFWGLFLGFVVSSLVTALL
jgi:hypothetical protein